VQTGGGDGRKEWSHQDPIGFGFEQAVSSASCFDKSVSVQDTASRTGTEGPGALGAGSLPGGGQHSDKRDSGTFGQAGAGGGGHGGWGGFLSGGSRQTAAQQNGGQAAGMCHHAAESGLQSGGGILHATLQFMFVMISWCLHQGTTMAGHKQVPTPLSLV